MWLQLKCFPGTLFGFVNISPHDSQYFNETAFNAIQGKLKADKSVMECVIMGDVNARFGKKLKELPDNLDMDSLSYPTIPDPIQVPNTMPIFCLEEK